MSVASCKGVEAASEIHHRIVMARPTGKGHQPDHEQPKRCDRDGNE
jgi:hypothetical protein